MTGSPKRKAVPMKAQRDIALTQLADALKRLGLIPVEMNVAWQLDHAPSLGIRPISEDGTDWEPRQHDPRFLVWMTKEAHDAKTYGTSQATSVGGDRHAIDHTRRLSESEVEFRRALLSRECNQPRERKGTIPSPRKKPKERQRMASKPLGKSTNCFRSTQP